MDEIKTFWSVSEENGKLSPEILDLYIFLQQRGFRKRTIADEIETWKQNGYFVEQCFTPGLINEIIGYLKNEFKENTKVIIEFPRKGPVPFIYTPKAILEKIVKYGWGKVFNENNFNHLPELAVNIKRHTHNSAFFYFRNGYVQVTKDEVKFLPYSTIEGQYIYKDVVIDRDITLYNVDDPVVQDFCPRGFQFMDFLSRISGLPENVSMASKDELEKTRYLMECLGFLLHDYKQQGLTDFGVIFCDDNIGGSGKGILIQALGHMTKVSTLDAKKEDNYDPEDLNERTRIKVYDDVEPNFDFHVVYNEITGNAKVRPMYKSPRYIPYDEAWKVAFTSNHIIRGITGADIRRQRVFSVASFFNEKYTPQDKYKSSFFSKDWKENDWSFFYCLMFNCARAWLLADYKLSYMDKDYAERKMEEEYPLEFRQYVEAMIAEVKTNGTQHISVSEFYYKFKEDQRYRLNPFVRKLTPNFFSRLLRKYLDGAADISYSRNHNRTELTIFLKNPKYLIH